MGANNHLTVVPENFEGDGDTAENSDETELDPNYGVLR